MTEADLDDLIRGLAERLSTRGWKLATAESCTGGWIAKCCTDLTGSSTWFERGFVTYSNEAKVEMLGVDSETLNVDGAVSRAVAEQMAEGARRAARAETAVAVTGIAGPDGGSADKPVGTVWFAWSLEGRGVDSERLLLEGDRNAVREQSVAQAVRGLLSRLDRV